MPRRSRNAEAVAAETRIENHVAARIRLRRGLLGMSQTDLAKAMGVTFQQVQKYEKGFNRVSVGKLLMLCTILDVPLSFFFDGIDEGYAGGAPIGRPDDAKGDSALLRRRELQLLRLLRAVDSAIADEVLGLLRRTAGLEDGLDSGGPAVQPIESHPAIVTANPPATTAVSSPKRRGLPPGSGKKEKGVTGNRVWSPNDIV